MRPHIGWPTVADLALTVLSFTRLSFTSSSPVPLAIRMTNQQITDAASPWDNKLPLTFVILTRNEEHNLPKCLASLMRYANDVHVLDSGSTDSTVAIARAHAVTVHTNPFNGFGRQRNWATDHIPHAHPWAFHLDADERLTSELADELRLLLATDPVEAGFYVPNKLLLGGHWLRYSSGYPVYQVRLFHRDRLRFENHGHGQREVTDGVLGYLNQPYIHDAFAKGLDDWFAKHWRYAKAEAETLFADRRSLAETVSHAMTGDTVRRRRAIKSLAYRLPGRVFLRWFHSLILNRGVLDGPAGWTYARMLAAYESMVTVHLSRLKNGIDL